MSTRALLSLSALCLLLPLASAQAAALVVFSSDQSATLHLDGQKTGFLGKNQQLTLEVAPAGTHELRLVSMGGVPLHSGSFEVPAAGELSVRWEAGQLAVQLGAATPEQVVPTAGRATSDEAAESAASSGSKAISGARTATTAAGVLLPGSAAVSAASSAASIASAAASAARGVRAIRSARSDDGAEGGSSGYARGDSTELSDVASSSLTHAQASAGAQGVAHMASVTFSLPAGQEALVYIDGQLVAKLTGGITQCTVQVLPGLRSVIIRDGSGSAMLHKGYLTSTAGYVFEVSFSHSSPPKSSLPGMWR